MTDKIPRVQARAEKARKLEAQQFRPATQNGWGKWWILVIGYVVLRASCG